MVEIKRDGQGFPIALETFVRTTGEEEDINITQEAFFDAIIEFLGYPENARGIYFNIEDYWAFPTEWMMDGDGKGFGNTTAKGRSTDTNLTLLTISDQRIIAQVVRWRTGFNHIQATFAHCLTPHLIEQVRFKHREEDGFDTF